MRRSPASWPCSVASHEVASIWPRDADSRDEGEIPLAPHDVRLDVVVTPERVLHCDHERQRSHGIRWEDLTEDKIASIPLLQRLRPGG